MRSSPSSSAPSKPNPNPNPNPSPNAYPNPYPNPYPKPYPNPYPNPSPNPDPNPNPKPNQVCSIYVVDGVRGVIGRFGGRPAQFGEALFATNLSLLTFGVSAWLSGATRWRVLSASLRSFLADYAVTLAVIATTVRGCYPTYPT